jgi:hypothetical protein
MGGRTASSRGDAYPPAAHAPQHQAVLAADHGPLASTGPACHKRHPPAYPPAPQPSIGKSR